MTATRDQIMDTALRTLFGHAYADADKAVRAIAGYQVPSNEDFGFVQFTEWINTRPAFIEEWRSESERELKLYVRFMNGIEACREGYSAASYHLSRLREIESAVHAILEEVNFNRIFVKGTVATLGSLQRCNFEYQAFIMAYRRALDHFAYGLSTLF